MPVVGVTMDACVQPPLSTHVEGRSLSSATRLVGTMARTCSTIDAALTCLSHPIIRIQKLAAAQFGGYIYTSTDSGVTWSQQTNSSYRFWHTIASSSDGTVRFVGAALHARRTTQTTWLPLEVVGEGTVESRRVLLLLMSLLPTPNPITYRNSRPC